MSLVTFLERLHRLRLWDLRAAVLAGAPRVIVPKIEHGLAEVLDDVGAVELDVFHERLAIRAIENDVLLLTGRAAALDDDTQRIRRSHGSMDHIRRDEERLALAHEMIHD